MDYLISIADKIVIIFIATRAAKWAFRNASPDKQLLGTHLVAFGVVAALYSFLANQTGQSSSTHLVDILIIQACFIGYDIYKSGK